MSDTKSDNVYGILTNPTKAYTFTIMKHTAQKPAQKVEHPTANGSHEDVMILKEQVKHLATKEDVALLHSDTKTEIANVRKEVADVRKEVADVRLEIADVRTEVVELRTEVKAIKEDIVELKSDVRYILRFLTYASISMIAFLASILATLLVKPM